MPKIRRIEILEEKIKQLEQYHDSSKCPERKLKTVRRLIEFYCRRLACL
jgi:hypothetical protein